jgi:hypothetical protein
MDSWLLLLPTGKRMAEAADLRRLVLALGPRVSLSVVECESATAGGAEQAALASALKRHPGAVGCMAFDFGLLPLLAACPGRMRRVLVFDGVPGWEPSAPVAALERALRLAAEIARDCPVDICAPASQVWAGLAALLFPSAKLLPPLPWLLKRGAQRPVHSGLPSVGMLVEGGSAYEGGMEELLAVWAAQLAPKVDASGPTAASAVQAKAELRLTPTFARLTEPAAGPSVVSVRAVAVASGRHTTGAEAVLFPLSAWLEAEQGARLAAAEGESLVGWLPSAAEGKPGAGRLFVPAAGGLAVEDWVADPRAAFSNGAAGASMEAVVASAQAAWEAALLGAELPAASVPGAAWLIDPAWVRAWVDAATSPGERALRLWQTRPHDAGALLSVAAGELRRDLGLGWRLVSLAHAWVRLGAERPDVPPSLLSEAGKMFAATGAAPDHEWRRLLDWLASLAPLEEAPVPLRTQAFGSADRYPAGGLELEFSAGLRRRGSGRHAFLGRSFLAVLSLADADVRRLAEARQLGARAALRFSLEPADRDWLTGLDIRVNGHAVGAWVDFEGAIAHLTVPLPEACKLSERLFLQGLAAAPPDAEVVLTDLELSASEISFGIEGLSLAHRLSLDRTAAAEGVFDVEMGAGGPCRWVDAEFALALPLSVKPGLLQVDTLVLRFALPSEAKTNGLPRQIRLGGETRPLHSARGEGEEAWFTASITWPPAEPGALFRVQTGLEAQPLTPQDPRVAAGLLTGAWLARSLPSEAGKDEPPGMALPLEDPQWFPMGWHAAEEFEGRAARWMGPSASVLMPRSVAGSGHLALLLSGPCIPFNVTDVPLVASHGGVALEERLYEVSETRWFRLFVTREPIDPALLAVEIALVAEQSRALGTNDPRVASSLVDSAAVVSFGAKAAGAPAEGLVVPLQTLVHENWGIGLVGSWLPAEMGYLFSGSAQPLRLCVEGAAATSRFAVEGLQALVDDEPVRGTHSIAQDGSWRKVFSVPAGRAQGAHLLRLRSPEIPDADAPGRTRVMLRRIFTESADAATATPKVAAVARGVS